WPCNSVDACLPSAVATMACRTFSIPTLVWAWAVEPAAGDDAWAPSVWAPARLAAARAAKGNGLFTGVSLMWEALVRTPGPIDWLKFVYPTLPAGFAGPVQTKKYSRGKPPQATAKRVSHGWQSRKVLHMRCTACAFALHRGPSIPGPSVRHGEDQKPVVGL